MLNPHKQVSDQVISSTHLNKVQAVHHHQQIPKISKLKLELMSQNLLKTLSEKI